MTYPIPAEAFDDRLAVTGTSGAGKTYLVLGALARMMKSGRRFIAADALGVMYGLRLKADGVTASEFKVVIFGGPHGDLPLSVGAAALIGETAAGMSESVILDLSGLGSKAAERRFMLGFLTALERHANREPVHLILDEADLWAPQRILDKEGESMKLLGKVDSIVRRGRVKGFIPWLITQRPAVLSKDVLSQADGIVAMKLTSSQDRDAIGGWIEGQADRAQAKATLALLPTLNLGEGVIWLPGHQVLKTAQFPANATFDSSRTPKRGEAVRKVDLKALDLGALKTRLAKVEEEAKANDPAALKAQVATLTGELAKARKGQPVAAAAPKDDAAALKDRERAFAAGRAEGVGFGWSEGWLAGWLVGYRTGFPEAQDLIKAALKSMVLDPGKPTAPKPPKDLGAALPTVAFADAPMRASLAAAGPVQLVPAKDPPPPAQLDAAGLTEPQRRIMSALGFWKSVGTEAPTRAQIAGVAGYSPKSSNFSNLIGGLNSAGLTVSSSGRVSLADGAPIYSMTAGEAKAKVRSILSPGQLKLVDAMLINPHGCGATMSREDLARVSEYSATSSNFSNLVGSLNTLNVFEKAGPGQVAMSAWAKAVLS